MAIRPRRSVLYMPGSNARALEKAKTLPADGVILDLEDAVAPDAKATARDQVVAAVKAGGFGAREVFIRTNGFDTPWFADDLTAAAGAAPDAILIPKISTPKQLELIAQRLLSMHSDHRVRIWAMIETPTAIFDVREIASHPRVAVLVMGTNDLAREIGAPQVPGRNNLTPYLSTAVLAAREAGKVILDGVYNDVRDEEGFAAECAQGVQMGFDGKTLIHPGQVGPANAAWSPTSDEVEYSRRVIEAFSAAEAEGRGVITVDGRMIENLHVANARRTLTVADAIAKLGS